MTLYYHEGALGCGLISARSLPSAKKKARDMIGTYNGTPHVRRATDDDVARVRAMGGYVPEETQ